MSSEYESVCKVITPAGGFDAVFGEDDEPVLYRGDDAAIQFFKNWLSINQISGEHGVLINADRITPNELYGFCQPPGSGIIVVAPLDDMLDYAEQDEIESDDNNERGEMGEMAMDSGGVYLDKDKDVIAATNRLIRYFRDFIASDFDKAKVPTAIYGWMATGQVMNKEDAKRRLRELIDIAINRKAGIEDITPKQKQRLDDYRHDARVISDYLTNRIRHTGSRNLLRTPEMKAKYPDIDNQVSFDSSATSTEVDCEILIVLDDDAALLLDSAHWVTTKTGSHLLIEGGTIVGGAGGKLNGTKVMTKKMLKDKEDDDTFIRREYNEEHDFGARLHGGPNGKKSAEEHAARLSRILGREFVVNKEGSHVFYGFDNKRYDLHRAIPKEKRALDSASGIEKIGLVKELSGIREAMRGVASGIDKLKMVRRVGEIRTLLGFKEIGGGLDKNGLDADGMWPMTKAEYKKIHKDYKGTFPDGTPHALKLVNGATTLVPVKITDETPGDDNKNQFNIGDYVIAIKDVDFYGKSPMKINHIKTDFSGGVGIQRLKLEGKGSMYFSAADFTKAGEDDGSAKVVAEKSLNDVRKVLSVLMQFVGKQQLETMLSLAKGEEGQFFIDKLIEVANTVSAMPKTYEQDGKGDDAIAYLHYFKGSGDWHVTEKDMEDEQLQAFGLANLGQGGELGYINIEELIGAGVELDLYWTPKTIGEIKNKNSGENLTIEEEFREKLKSFGDLYMRLRKLRGLEDDNPDAVLRYRIDDLVSDLKRYEKSGGREYSGKQLDDEIAILQESIEKHKLTAYSSQNDIIVKAFIAELEALKSETDITAFGDKLDEIAGRIEQAGVMAELDAELNSAADALTELMAAAEKAT